MSRVYESIDITEAQADAAIAAAMNDTPPASDTQKISQPNGLYTVICTYQDLSADQAPKANGGGAGAVGNGASAPANSGGVVKPAANNTAAAPKPGAPVLGQAVPPQQNQGPTSAPQAQAAAALAAPAAAPATPSAAARVATPVAAPVAKPQANANVQAQPMITLGMLQRHWPRAAADILQGIANSAASVFASTEINTPLRVAHFMAQISAECGAGTEMVENLNYTAQRLLVVWPSRFPTLQSALPYAGNPAALGDRVYNGRMGNSTGTDDGYNYRGRGCLQLTGRDNYQEIGQLCGLDLIDKQNLVVDPSHTLLIAATEFTNAGCLRWCDEDSVLEVSALINLGHLPPNPNSIVGFADREAWLQTWKHELGF